MPNSHSSFAGRSSFAPNFINSSSSNFKKAHININHLMTHTEELRSCVFDGNYDIVMSTETFLDEHDSDTVIAMDGFTVYRHDCRHTSPGG